MLWKKRQGDRYLQSIGNVTSMTWDASLYFPPDMDSSPISATIFSRVGKFCASWSITSETDKKYNYAP